MSKLHLGCGQQYLPGYINLEYAKNFKDLPYKIDMLGSGMELPFKNNSLDEILSYHVIEHMPRPQKKEIKHNKWRKNIDDFLNESFRTLKYGGKIIAECPDVERILKELVENNNWEMLDHIYGLDRYPGDTHQWGYTRKSLAELFKRNGFDNIRISDGSDFHSIEEPSLRVEATKIGLKRINIEPTSACNLACTICTRDEKKRPNANMDFNLYRSIIYQLYNHGLQEIEIRYFLSGEPLVAGKNLINMIKYATSVGFKNTLIHTNGTLLNKYGEDILKAGIGTVSISFDGSDKETYENIRVNSQFEKTVEYIKNFLKLTKTYQTKTIVQTIVKSGTDKTKYEQKMRELLPGADKYYVRYPHNWNTTDSIAGAVFRSDKITECFPSENLSIYADGRVPICCADLNGDYILADANKETLMDIWINKLGSIRDRMKKRESIPELCNDCERYGYKSTQNEEGQFLKAKTMIEEGNLESAQRILSELLEKKETANILIDLAVINIFQENYMGASKLLNKALFIEPNNKIALENLLFIKQKFENQPT